MVALIIIGSILFYAAIGTILAGLFMDNNATQNDVWVGIILWPIIYLVAIYWSVFEYLQYKRNSK
jgi:MFS-type transporter involved in bile tolerance (Atg22 family)